MTNVFQLKQKEPSDVVGPKENLNDAFKELELENFFKNVITKFSDQVTCVCTKTGSPLFDIQKARIIRDVLANAFTALLETIDEEIEEFGKK